MGVEEEVMPKGGERAPRASFSRKTSLDNSVICANVETSVLLSRREQLLENSHLTILFLDQALGLLNVLV